MGNGIIKFLVDSFLSVVYSKSENCIICEAYCSDEQFICKSCFKKIDFLNDSFLLKKNGIEFECYSTAYYSGIIAELVKRLKYRSDFNSGEVLAKMLIDLLTAKPIQYDLITYIPMTKASLKVRGFNQGRFLAVEIGRNFNKSVEELVVKVKNTKDQIGLDEENRWENLKDCFRVINKNKIIGKKILIVDDVITTGATAFWAAKEILNSGAEKISVLTVAKSKL